MPFDLIATDLDGTFLSDDKQVHPINAAAVRAAADRGIRTVFATGRPGRWLGVLDELADAHSWAIASNGAVTLDLATGELLHARTIDPQVAVEVAREVREVLPNTVCAMEYRWQWAAEHGYPPRLDGERATYVGELDELFAREPVVKLLILDPTTPTDELAATVTPIVGDRLTTTFSYVSPTGMLELSAPGVSKALALTELLADLGIGADRLIAFGDMPNDLAMLELAGTAYAMAHSHETVLAAGYPIAGDNNDAGVGRTLLSLLGGS